MSWLGNSISSFTKEISNIGAYTKEILRETREESTDHVAELAVAKDRIKELESILEANKVELEKVKHHNAELCERSQASDIQLASVIEENRNILSEKDKELNRLRQDLDGGSNGLTPRDSDPTHHRSSSKGSSASWTDTGDFENFVQELEGKLRDEVEGRQQDVTALQDFYKSKLASTCRDYEKQIKELNEGLAKLSQNQQVATCGSDVDSSFTKVCTWDEIQKFKEDLISFFRATLQDLSKQQGLKLVNVLQDYTSSNPYVWEDVCSTVKTTVETLQERSHDEKECLQEQLSAQVAWSQQLLSDIEKWEKDANTLDTHKKELEGKVNTLSEEKSDLAKRLSEHEETQTVSRLELEGQLENLKKENNELQKGIEQLDEEHGQAIDQLLTAKESLQVELSNARAEVFAMQSAADNNTCRIQELEEENEFLKLENQELRLAESTHMKTNTDSGDIEANLRQIMQVEDDIDVLGLVQGRMKQFSELQWKTETLEKKLVESSADVKTFKESVRDLREEKLELERECCELKDKVQHLSVELEISLEQHGRLETIEENEEDRDVLNEQIASLEKELMSFKHDLEIAKRSNTELQAKFDTFHHNSTTMVFEILNNIAVHFSNFKLDNEKLTVVQSCSDWSLLSQCYTIIPSSLQLSDKSAQTEQFEEKDLLISQSREHMKIRIQELEQMNAKVLADIEKKAQKIAQVENINANLMESLSSDCTIPEQDDLLPELQLNEDVKFKLQQKLHNYSLTVVMLQRKMTLLLKVVKMLISDNDSEVIDCVLSQNDLVENMLFECRKEKDALALEIGQLEQVSADVSTELNISKCQVSSQAGRLAEVETERQTLETELKCKVVLIEKLKKEVETLKMTIQVSESEQKDSVAELLRLRSSLNESKNISRLLTEKDQLISGLERIKAESEKCIADKENEISQLKEKVILLEEKMNLMIEEIPKKGLFEHKMRAKDKQLQSKTEEFKRILDSKEEEMAQTEKKLTSLQDQNNKLIQDLERLQAHIIDLNRYYDDQILQMETREQQLKQQLEELKEQVASSTAVYTSVNEQTLSDLQSLRHKYESVSTDREQLLHQLSEKHTQNELNIQSLKNLQIVLDQFEACKEIDLERLRKEHDEKVEATVAECRKLENQLSKLKDELNTANDGLQAASRLNKQITAKDVLIKELKQQVVEYSNDITKLKSKLEAFNSDNKDLIDRDVTKNLLVNYLVANGQQKIDIMKVIAHILDFNAEDMSKIGLNDQKVSSWLPGLLKRPTSSLAPISESNTSLTHAFIHFLEEESKPKHKPVMKLPAQDIASEVGNQRAASSSLLFQTPLEFSGPNSTTSSRGSTPLGFTTSLKPMSSSLPVLKPSPVLPDDATLSFLRDAFHKENS